MTFEVITVGGLRWQVLVGAEGASALNDAIQRGLILDAKAYRVSDDEYPWSLNAAHIIAYKEVED